MVEIWLEYGLLYLFLLSSKFWNEDSFNDKRCGFVSEFEILSRQKGVSFWVMIFICTRDSTFALEFLKKSWLKMTLNFLKLTDKITSFVVEIVFIILKKREKNQQSFSVVFCKFLLAKNQDFNKRQVPK